MKKSAFVREQVAQAVVEMAVVAPVMIVLGLIVYNLMTFLAATARFDRVAPDIVLVHGCAPSGAGELPAGEGMASTVRAQLEQAMGEYDVEIEVRESGAIEGSRNDAAPGEGRLALVGSLRTYRCLLRYRPWPCGLSIAGVDLGAPFELVHERSVTVDPWRSGVLV